MVQHYFTKNPESEYREYKIEAVLRDFELEFKTASGVFSPRRIDRGSKALIKYMQVPKTGKILDLGCGYGPVGVVIAKLSPTAEVILSDINKRAVKLARTNIKLNKVTNAKAVQGEFLDKLTQKFDAILLNPPISAGRKVSYKLIEDAYEKLNKKGTLQVVARRNKGGKPLFDLMDELFSETEVLAKSGGFWVYKGVK